MKADSTMDEAGNRGQELNGGLEERPARSPEEAGDRPGRGILQTQSSHQQEHRSAFPNPKGTYITSTPLRHSTAEGAGQHEVTRCRTAPPNIEWGWGRRGGPRGRGRRFR